MMRFWLCFVSLFVAVDALGTLPLLTVLTKGLSRAKVQRMVWQSIWTAMIVALLFLAIGRWLLGLLGITVADFMVAGGTLLFAISLSDLLTGERRQRPLDPESLGAVPLGVPLIVGPAVLATTLLLVQEHGVLSTVSAIVANILIAGGLFWFSDAIVRLVGKAGAKTISKLSSLILAAIGVMIVRKGVLMLVATPFQ